MTTPKTEPDDEPLQFNIKTVGGHSVMLEFNKEIAWVGFTKKEALAIAKFLRKAALTLS